MKIRRKGEPNYNDTILGIHFKNGVSQTDFSYDLWKRLQNIDGSHYEEITEAVECEECKKETRRN